MLTYTLGLHGSKKEGLKSSYVTVLWFLRFLFEKSKRKNPQPLLPDGTLIYNE